jgi:hypothetical protein
VVAVRCAAERPQDLVADRAEVMASYAKQAKDDALEVLAIKIRARTIRRCGELLRAIERPRPGGRPAKNGVGAYPVSRTHLYCA